MSATLKETNPCPSCGKPMPTGALAGLCPACLLAQGAEADESVPAGAARFEPPSIAHVAKLFPQLEILSLLGAGGMGAVYKARQPALDRIVALKILPSSGAGGTNFAERFNREARALARLSHPNIVAVHEFGAGGGLHYFIMEFVDGANLRQLESAGRLSPREALQIIPQICDALQYAHDEGIVHRDIKPENVLVDRKGRVKIADFGLAKILGQEAESLRLTAEGQVMGTPHYMAPEQLERPLAVDHRADIYSLGVVFYEMLTGDLPLGKFSPPSRKVQIDVRLDDVVLRALENDPVRRYQRASEVRSEVETIAATPAPSKPPVPSAPVTNYVRWLRFPVVAESEGQRAVHWKGALALGGVVLGILTLAFAVVSAFTGRSLLGWIGVIGWQSLIARMVIAALVTIFGVWRALRSERAAEPAGTARHGTMVLPRPGVSRKAIVGAIWAPMLAILAVLWFTPSRVTAIGDATHLPQPQMEWWQILLAATLLPLGVSAPFGATILGSLAIGDIRRSQGRITGLPLALFDGLFYPLLALDALVLWAWPSAVRAFAEAIGNPDFTGPWPAIARIGAVTLCLVADFDIARRVWRVVRRESVSKPRTAAQRMAIGLAGLAAVTAGIVAVVIAAQQTDKRFGTAPLRHQVAEFDAKTGSLTAKLPGRGAASLLAISDSGAAANAWWRPDGAAIPDALFEVRAPNDQLNTDFKNRDFIVRWRDLPEGASGPTLRIDSAAGGSAGGDGLVFRDGKELSSAWLVRGSFVVSAKTAAVWLGFGLESWQTLGTYAGNGQSSQMRVLPDVPSLQGRLHQISEEGSNVVVTILWNAKTATGASVSWPWTPTASSTVFPAAPPRRLRTRPCGPTASGCGARS